MLPGGTHGFVIERFVSPETYEVEFDLDGDLILGTVQPEDFGVAWVARVPGDQGGRI
jgi:hypothetical protein